MPLHDKGHITRAVLNPNTLIFKWGEVMPKAR